MGNSQVSAVDDEQARAFTQALLNDVKALEQMLERGMFEHGIRRIGAEQEMFLVGASMRPAPVALEALERASDPRLTTELARFNLEANLTPRLLGGACLRELHAEIEELVQKVRGAVSSVAADVVLTGILPTLELEDLDLDHMTPSPRYYAINDALTRARGGAFRVHLRGVDEIDVTHPNIMLESCNTSFQVHLEVDPASFARLYNLAQAITAPVLACAVNSPLLLGRRLWQETRIALFEQAVDERADARRARAGRARVSFGDAWVKSSVLEIVRDDIARYRVVLTGDVGEDSLAAALRGEAPKLAALRIHNGTVYRWNRPCYGVADGVAHLRIEHRALPSGPTIADEVANAALFYGLMIGGDAEYGDVTTRLAFDDARANFVAAARLGLGAPLVWMDGRRASAAELLREHLLPLARAGLSAAGVDAADSDAYLGLIEARVGAARTGADWILASYAALSGERAAARARALVSAMLEQQRAGIPGHAWPIARGMERGGVGGSGAPRPSERTVREIMSEDLFTVRAEDNVDLAASIMDWEHVRHVPVEDEAGRLVGMLTHRTLLRLLAEGGARASRVEEVMETSVVTVGPDASLLTAMRLMRENEVSGLPVVEDGKLLGIVTERDLMSVVEERFGASD